MPPMNSRAATPSDSRRAPHVACRRWRRHSESAAVNASSPRAMWTVPLTDRIFRNGAFSHQAPFLDAPRSTTASHGALSPRGARAPRAAARRLAPVECGAGRGGAGTAGPAATAPPGPGWAAEGPTSAPASHGSAPKGHVSGGTTLTIRGRGFVRSAHLRVRFADENAVEYVRGTWVSSGEVTCVTPARPAGDDAGDRQRRRVVERALLVYVAGSGTALTFAYDDSPPGCWCAAPGGFRRRCRRGNARGHGSRTEILGPDSGARRCTSSANGGMRLNRRRVYPVIVHRHDVGAQVLGPERRARARREGLRRRPDQPG